jgi:hypothetical protein
MFLFDNKKSNTVAKTNMVQNTTKRTFTVIDYPKQGDTFGKYKSLSFSAAAKKAIKGLSKQFDILSNSKQDMNNQFIKFWLKEITAGSSKQEKCYIGLPVKLAEPIVVNRGGKQISYKYKYIVTKYNDNFYIE